MLQLLSRARKSSAPGLPEVKPAREAADSPRLGSAGGPTRSPPPRLNTNKPRTTLELNVTCAGCGERGVKLVLRGPAISRSDFGPSAAFECKRCIVAALPSTSRLAGRALPHFPPYSSTISAAIDRLEGVTLADPPPADPDAEVEVPEGGPGGLSRLKCDCCMRVVGRGRVADEADPSAAFTAEIVCTHCQDLYRLCSDCGGGGGRLTIGRWRSLELFPHGRKTCRLSHARNPRLNELQWSVYQTSEIPPELMDYIRDGCKAQYFQSRLQTTARPEALEYGVALSRTYAQAAQLTLDSWNLVSRCLTEDAEADRGVRRYVAFQAAMPATRRSKSKAKTQTGSEDNPIITGFLFAEWDMLKGTLHYPAAFPWAVTGDAFDATTRTGELAIMRVRDDLARENARRLSEGRATLPELKCVWLLSPFSKDSRAFVSLRTRGYVSLTELRHGPQASEWNEWEASCRGTGGVFPPEREVHIPKPFVETYELAVRILDGPDDLGGPPARRRPRKGGSQDATEAPAPPSRRK